MSGSIASAGGSVLKKAYSLHQTGKLDEAASLYRKILKQDPRNADALYGAERGAGWGTGKHSGSAGRLGAPRQFRWPVIGEMGKGRGGAVADAGLMRT